MIKWVGEALARPSLVLPLDQVLFATTNFLPLLLLGSTMEAADFGTFALFFGAISGVGVLLRSWTGVPALLAEENGKGAAVAVSVLAGALVGVAAIALTFAFVDSRESRFVICAFALGSAPAYAVDALRHQAMGSGSLRKLVRLEMTWLAAEIPLLVFGLLGSSAAPYAIAVAWPAGALLAFLSISPQIDISKVGVWYAQTRSTGRSLSLDAAVNFVRQQGYLFLLAGVAGLAVAGSYRLAVGIVAPATMAIVGWRNHTIVSLRAGSTTSSRRAVLVGVPIAIGLLVVCASYLAPNALIARLEGNTDAGELLPTLAILALLASMDSFAQASMISQHRSSDVAKARVMTTVLWLSPLLLWPPQDTSAVTSLLLISGALSTIVWIAVGVVSGAVNRRSAAVAEVRSSSRGQVA